MAKFCRHFKALVRKNWIVQVRNPICSIFELVLPVGLMLILWWLRTLIHLKKVDQTHLQQYKHSVFAGLKYEESRLGGSWSWDADFINEQVADFYQYVGYTPRRPLSDPATFTAVANQGKQIDSVQRFNLSFSMQNQLK